MKLKVAATAVIVAVGLGLAAFVVTRSQAQSDLESPNLARFVALMQYMRSEPTPSNVDPSGLNLLDSLDATLIEIYITSFIMPFTGETFDQANERLQTIPEEDRFAAAMVEAYRLSADDTLLNFVHALMSRYYVELFIQGVDLDGALDFLESINIASLANAFDHEQYTLPPPTEAPPDGPGLPLLHDPMGEDRSCDDFPTWAQAQAFFFATKDDSHGLDPDGNGIACENLPDAPAVYTTGGDSPARLYLAYDPDGEDRDCADFDSWREAQAFYLADEDNLHGLDPDWDGIACGHLPDAPRQIGES